MRTPDRIRNADAYRLGQPDLDVYTPCFEGFCSPRFCGSDLDGLFAVGMAVHGVWERRGHLLVHEHKVSPRAWRRGQWWALNALARVEEATLRDVLRHAREQPALGRDAWGELVVRALDDAPRRLRVVVTYGEDPDRPTGYQWLPLRGFAWHHDVEPMDLADVESIPHRAWIRDVAAGGRASTAATREESR